jgi:NADH-quinone oxidoreductase subunit M
MGAFQHNFWLGLLEDTAVILGSSYSLWLLYGLAFGGIANDKVRNMTDLSSREFFILGLMAIAVLYMGIYPKPFTDVMHVSVEALLQHVSISKL